MSSYCSDPAACLNGNCIGCKDGKVWCQDPRCEPYCPGNSCAIPNDHDFNGSMVVIIIILCLITILFIVWFVYGPQWIEYHDDHARANVIVPEEYYSTKSQPPQKATTISKRELQTTTQPSQTATTISKQLPQTTITSQ